MKMIFNKINSTLGRIKNRIKAIIKFHSSVHNGNELNELIKRLSELEHRVGDKTTIHCDIHQLKDDMIIAVGRYRNHDLVRIFNVGSYDFVDLIKQLKQLEKHARIGKLDHGSSSDWLRKGIEKHTKDGRF